MIVEYSSNNSGGGWWLNDDDWKNLEKAGWKVNWKGESYSEYVDSFEKAKRHLGALATTATFECNSIEEAIANFENITGENADDVGCECCGQPHSFY